MRCLIAGIGGYLGMPLAYAMVKKGHEVIGFDRLFFCKRPKDIEFWIGDTRDMTPSSLSGFDVVMDLAGLSNDASCEIDPSYTKSINEEGGKNLFGSAQKASVRRYIYSSSASVYGAGTKQGLTENDPVNPLTPYAKSKLAVENFIRARKAYNESVIMRTSTVFGLSPRMRFDLSVNTMTRDAWKHGVIKIEGGGSQVRPFIHVNDVVEAFIWAAEAPAKQVRGQIFNIGFEQQQLSIRNLASLVAMAFPNARIADRSNGADARSYHLSFHKYARASNITKYASVESGIAEIKWALDDGKLDADDPSTMTMPWYRDMLQWNNRLEQIRLHGRLL